MSIREPAQQTSNQLVSAPLGHSTDLGVHILTRLKFNFLIRGELIHKPGDLTLADASPL